MALEITDSNYKEVLAEGKPVVVDFWAPWCNPCRMLGPIIEEVAEEVTDVKICKVNVDDEAELAQMFHVTSIPLVVIMENGKLIKTSLGYKPKDEIIELLK